MSGIDSSRTTFGALGVPTPIVSALDRDHITTPFPIQSDTLPDTLSGRDVLGRGRTGSGKTLAFAIPLVVRLGATSPGNGGAHGRPARGTRRPARPAGLVLAPTRELASQTEAVLRPLADVYGLTTTTIFGGVSQHRQVAALGRGVDIVVACPGRLEDLIAQHYVTLAAVRITVLDEADHMADLGFLPAVTRLLGQTPADGQRMLFSATLDRGVDKLVRRFLHDQVLHSADDIAAPMSTMTHHVFEVATPQAKSAVVRTLASGTGRRILFTRTKHHAKKLAKQLTESGIPSVDLHGNLSQPQRDRHLAAFSDGTAHVLVATDVAARGVHVDDVRLVVHVDPPVEHKAYLHRSGRTARAGHGGDVVTLALPEQRRDLAQVLRRAAIKAAPIPVTATHARVEALVGETAPYVAPVAPARQVGGRPNGSRDTGGDRRRRPTGGRPGRTRAHSARATRTRATQDGSTQDGSTQDRRSTSRGATPTATRRPGGRASSAAAFSAASGRSRTRRAGARQKSGR